MVAVHSLQPLANKIHAALLIVGVLFRKKKEKVDRKKKAFSLPILSVLAAKEQQQGLRYVVGGGYGCFACSEFSKRSQCKKSRARQFAAACNIWQRRCSAAATVYQHG